MANETIFYLTQCQPSPFRAVWTPLLYIQKCAILIFRKFSDAHKNGAFEALNCRMVLKLTGHVQKDVSIGCEWSKFWLTRWSLNAPIFNFENSKNSNFCCKIASFGAFKLLKFDSYYLTTSFSLLQNICNVSFPKLFSKCFGDV